MFPLKDRERDMFSVIYEGKCLHGRRCIDETIRKSDIHWNGQESATGKVEPAKHLPDNKSQWKILEAFFVTKLKSNLNVEIEHHALSSFRHGVTWIDKWYLSSRYVPF